MPVFHVTMFFSTREHGWVEQFYRQAVSLQQALKDGLLLAQARYSILGAGVALYKVRVTDPLFPRAVGTVNVSGTTLATPAPSAFEGAEIRLDAGSVNRNFRSYFLRGLPRDAVRGGSGSGSWSPSIAFAARTWLARLTDGKWMSKCRTEIGPSLPIAGLYPSVNPAGNAALVPPAPPGPSPYSEAVLATFGSPLPQPGPDLLGDPEVWVRVSRAKWDDLWAVQGYEINGEFQLVSVAERMVWYLGSAPPTGNYAGGGTLQFVRQEFLPIRSALLTHAGTRKCGPVPKGAPLPGQPAGPSDLVFSGLPELGPLLPGGRPLDLPFSPSAATNIYQALVGLATELAGPPNPPPAPPAPQPPPFPQPVSGILRNAQDCLRYINDNMTQSGSGDDYRPIGIAQVMNMVNTWWIGLAGFYLTENSDTGIFASVTAGVAQLNVYAQNVIRRIRENIPADAQIIFQGFSLGGMTLENVFDVGDIGPRVLVVNTYGSPPTRVQLGFRPIIRFKVVGDAVPLMTPLGLASGLTGDLPYEPLIADPRFPYFPANHIHMFDNPGLEFYDNWGLQGSDNPIFVLGNLLRFPSQGG